MNFVAIDFETANEKRNSPCSLGLTVVKNSKIEKELYWLIRPYELRFAPINIMIHGIRPGDVEHKKTFDQLWPEIEPYLKEQIIVAHNASFDCSVLRNTLSLYHIPYPNLNYCCTMVLAKQFYPFLDNAKLDTINQHLNYDFNHHHASADATACANIVLSAAQELQVTSIEELLSKTGIRMGQLYPGGYLSCSRNGKSAISSTQFASQTRRKKVPSSLYLKDKYIALTGPLRTMSRQEAISAIQSLGGHYCSSVSKKTEILITNTPSPLTLQSNQMSTKLRKATTLMKSGSCLEIYPETIFYVDDPTQLNQ